MLVASFLYSFFRLLTIRFASFIFVLLIKNVWYIVRLYLKFVKNSNIFIKSISILLYIYYTISNSYT